MRREKVTCGGFVCVFAAVAITHAARAGFALPVPAPPVPPTIANIQQIPNELPNHLGSGRKVAHETFKNGSQRPKAIAPYAIGLPPQ
jgi:hypothetical protein